MKLVFNPKVGNDLFKLLTLDGTAHIRRLCGLSIVVGLLNTSIVGLINLAANNVVNKEPVTSLFFVFSASILFLMYVTKKSTTENIFTTQESIYKLKLRILRDIYNTNISKVDTIGINYISDVMVRDSQIVSQSLLIVVNTMQSIATLIFLTLYLFAISLFAATVLCVSISIIFVFAVLKIKNLNSEFFNVVEEETNVNLKYSEFLNGFKEIKMNSTLAYGLISELTESSEKFNLNKSKVISNLTNFFNFLQIILYVIVGAIVFIVPLFSDNFYQSVTTAATTALFLAGSLNGLIVSIPNLSQADMAAKSLLDLAARLEIDKPAKEPSSNVAQFDKFQSLVLSNVTYKYNSNSHGAENLFNLGPININIKSGLIYFIRGNNGSGKTTLARLILGLYPPSSGQIFLNGKVVNTDLSEYRDLYSVIFFDFHLFSKLYGLESVDENSVENNLNFFGLKDKVKFKNNGFDNLNLSTGQRKRLALIYAILYDKDVILLDEWAADQDPIFRGVFYTQILPMLKNNGKTIIAISHDDSYFYCADHVFEMFNGKIVNV